jgi:hypothetical protein
MIILFSKILTLYWTNPLNHNYDIEPKKWQLYEIINVKYFFQKKFFNFIKKVIKDVFNKEIVWTLMSNIY